MCGNWAVVRPTSNSPTAYLKAPEDRQTNDVSRVTDHVLRSWPCVGPQVIGSPSRRIDCSSVCQRMFGVQLSALEPEQG